MNCSERTLARNGCFISYFQRLGWWIPELPHIRLRPKFSVWKSLSKFGRQYAQGRYDEIIPRLERELESRGPNDDIHHELGLAYNAIGDHERALTHLQVAVDWRKAHPEPRSSSDEQDVGLGCAYSNLAGVLESLGRHEEAEAAVRAGLVVNGKNFMLINQQAKYLIERDDLDEAIQHLDVSLKDSAPVFDQGKTLLLFLSTDKFDPLRKDPRFGGLVQRAYGELAGMVEPLAGDAEVEAALRDSLAGDGEGFLEHCQQAKHCLESGDFDGTFDHLEASLNDGGRVADPGKLLLFVLCAHEFDLLRKDPRFDHLLLNASHHSKH